MARGKLNKRKKGLRELIPIAVIVCEGKKTEVNYFHNFKKRRGIKLEILNSGHNDAAGIIKDASKMFERYDLSIRNGDTVHAVFDCDDNTQKQLDKAKSMALRRKIKLVFSNPCFELWFLLHFMDMNNQINRYDVIQKLSNHLKDYSKSKDYYCELKPYQAKAIERGEKLISQQGNQLPLHINANPVTLVGRLISYILENTVEK